jgi:uncharacterized protein YyaL (SSP411 family)
MPSGTVGGDQFPIVFNTGSALAAWVRGYRETEEKTFLESAQRAAEFLLQHQDEDGAWRKYSTREEEGARTHDIRTAWALLLYAELAEDRQCRIAAEKNLHYTLTKRLDNGWFQENCLRRKYHPTPLLHTIGYAIRGLLETGVLLGNEQAIERGILAARALTTRQAADGSLKGRYDASWTPTVSWCCLSGLSQMATCWLRSFAITGEQLFLLAGRRAIEFLKSRQDRSTSLSHIRGGLSGSYPIYGDFGAFQYPNWTVTFFLDALLKAKRLSEKSML